MLKQIVNYLKNNRIDCHADKSARNGRVCHYGVFALCRTKQFAFTLAETLIVMGIIGVVAALTLPNLNSSTGDKEKVAKVKKIYSNLNDAVGRAQAVYGPIDEWCSGYSGNCGQRGFERITEFMKVSKTCVVTDTNCSFNSLESADDSVHGVSRYYSALLADGTVIDVIGYRWNNEKIFRIYIDIDGGNKGKNMGGYDWFKVFADKNGVYTKPSSAIFPAHAPQGSYWADYAASWVINVGNMDYLKANITNGKCPDGKTILDGVSNTTCK